MPAKTHAEHQWVPRQRLKASGCIHFTEWVTPDEATALRTLWQGDVVNGSRSDRVTQLLTNVQKSSI